MQKTNNRITRTFKKSLRFLLFFLLGLIIAVNLFIVLSGRFYMYKGIRHTYLVGKTGPTIYDLDVFPYTTLKASDSSEPWKTQAKEKQFNLGEKELQFMKELQTKAFLVFRGNELIYEKYFDQHAVNTVSNSFSAAKTVVALLVGIAVEEGKIKSLDEPAANYIPEFKSQGREKITIRHLLLMASGLDWEESAKNPLSENAESYYGTDLRGLVTRQHSVATPGKAFNYQSGNSQLLGYIVEKATGKTVSEYTQEKLWKPIGAEHEAYWSLDKENGDEKSFCCLYATARDFGRLGKLILQKGKWNGKQLVPAWYMEEMNKLAPMSTEEGITNQRYGLHIWIYNDQGTAIPYCRGIKGQYIIADQKENLVIVRLGSERKDNFVIPEGKKGDPLYFEKYKARIGHPIDFFQFLAIGRKIDSQTN